MCIFPHKSNVGASYMHFLVRESLHTNGVSHIFRRCWYVARKSLHLYTVRFREKLYIYMFGISFLTKGCELEKKNQYGLSKCPKELRRAKKPYHFAAGQGRPIFFRLQGKNIKTAPCGYIQTVYTCSLSAFKSQKIEKAPPTCVIHASLQKHRVLCKSMRKTSVFKLERHVAIASRCCN